MTAVERDVASGSGSGLDGGVDAPTEAQPPVVTGRRIMTANGEERRALVENVVATLLTLSEVFTRESVEEWLREPHQMLDGRPAIELLYEGSDRPWRIAEALADGAFL